MRFWDGADPLNECLSIEPRRHEYAIFGSRFWEIIFSAHVYDRALGTLAPEHIQPWNYYYTELYLHLSRGGVVVWVVWSEQRCGCWTQLGSAGKAAR